MKAYTASESETKNNLDVLLTLLEIGIVLHNLEVFTRSE
jgi:hypothetical protein